jgi:hypothetical protein
MFLIIANDMPDIPAGRSKNRKWWHQLREQRQKDALSPRNIGLQFISATIPYACPVTREYTMVHGSRYLADRYTTDITLPDRPVYTSQIS